MVEEANLGQMLVALAAIPEQHAPSSPVYRVLASAARAIVLNSSLAPGRDGRLALGSFGEIHLPYHRMGMIDSLDLFGLDELILFAFYSTNRARYGRAVDVGANLGIHTVLMSRCGWSVTAYEPDPVHASRLRDHLALNGVDADLHVSAVSSQSGEREFVRVLDNTTSSHLAGAKSSPYGNLERFTVSVESASSALAVADFAKIDAEGSEVEILASLPRVRWSTLDVMAEIGSPDGARQVFDLARVMGIYAFAQKRGWRQVKRLEDMPTSYREGSLFMTGSDTPPWCSQ
jgi:FkbM family methyltransferase